VPVAIPLVVGPGLLTLAISANADRGYWPVAGALACGVGLLTLATLAPTDGPGGRVLAWAGRLTAAGLLLVSVLLVVAGILDV
jgi:small neutral amino acid transporter SnatA (MarC family)